MIKKKGIKDDQDHKLGYMGEDALKQRGKEGNRAGWKE